MYEYSNDYERENVSPFVGVYTAEEISLNRQLYYACTNEVVDFDLVESLLQQGADPLGGLAENGWDLLDHVYTEVILDSLYSDCAHLPHITKLFLQYGMDVAKPRIPYDDNNSLHPLWAFGHAFNENAAIALKMLLEADLDIDSVQTMWMHSMSDLIDIECGDPNGEWNDVCTWALKLMLLCASYDHILDNDAYLQKEIGCAYNSFNTHLFRDWNRFTYTYDTSRCKNHPELLRSVVHIYDTVTQREVWKIGFGLKPGTF